MLLQFNLIYLQKSRILGIVDEAIKLLLAEPETRIIEL